MDHLVQVLGQSEVLRRWIPRSRRATPLGEAWSSTSATAVLDRGDRHPPWPAAMTLAARFIALTEVVAVPALGLTGTDSHSHPERGRWLAQVSAARPCWVRGWPLPGSRRQISKYGDHPSPVLFNTVPRAGSTGVVEDLSWRARAPAISSPSLPRGSAPLDIGEEKRLHRERNIRGALRPRARTTLALRWMSTTSSSRRRSRVGIPLSHRIRLPRGEVARTHGSAQFRGDHRAIGPFQSDVGQRLGIVPHCRRGCRRQTLQGG